MADYDDDVRYVCPACGSEYARVPRFAECLDCGSHLTDLHGREVQPDEAKDAEVEVAPFETDNPWLLRLFQHRAFGRAPAAAATVLREVSADEDEMLFLAIRVRHGMLRTGFLLLTTHGVRWVQTVPIRSNDYWPLAAGIRMSGALGGGGVLHVPTGQQFQGLWTQCRAFVECFQLAQQAAGWAEQAEARDAAPPTPAPVAGLADEVTRLAELHRAGVLTDDEFAAAKAKLFS